MAGINLPFTASSRDLTRAIEDLRGPYQALQMAAAGISAGMVAKTADESGVYYLLLAVASQFDQAIAQLENLMETRRDGPNHPQNHGASR